MHQCESCKTEKNNTRYYSKGNGRYRCRECNTRICATYRATKNGRKKIRQAVSKSTLKYQNRQDARALVARAIKNGKLKRPTKCFNCKKDKKVQGHHKDYSFPLVVVWLCTVCHSDVHRDKV